MLTKKNECGCGATKNTPAPATCGCGSACNCGQNCTCNPCHCNG